jgi:hypothetical protein
MAATRNYARHLRVITVLQTKSRQLRNLITLTKCAIILKQILGINLSMLVCLLSSPRLQLLGAWLAEACLAAAECLLAGCCLPAG